MPSMDRFYMTMKKCQNEHIVIYGIVSKRFSNTKKDDMINLLEEI